MPTRVLTSMRSIDAFMMPLRVIYASAPLRSLTLSRYVDPLSSVNTSLAFAPLMFFTSPVSKPLSQCSYASPRSPACTIRYASISTSSFFITTASECSSTADGAKSRLLESAWRNSQFITTGNSTGKQ